MRLYFWLIAPLRVYRIGIGDLTATQVNDTATRERAMASDAAYDQIADWYENEFLGRPDAERQDGNPRSLSRALGDLLGEGQGACLEIGCGTGIHAAQVFNVGSVDQVKFQRGRGGIVPADGDRPDESAFARRQSADLAARLRPATVEDVHPKTAGCCMRTCDENELRSAEAARAGWTDRRVQLRVRPVPTAPGRFASPALLAPAASS